MQTGLWNLKDIQNSRQNCFKNKLVGEDALTPRSVWELPGTGYGLLWAPGYIFLSSDVKNDESLIRVLAMYMKYIGLSHCPPNQFVRSLSYTLLIILHLKFLA